MARTFHIHRSGGRPFPLVVPSAEVQSQELVGCVRDRLGITPGTPFFFTYEPAPGLPLGEETVPLCAALPDGTSLRLVLLQRSEVAQIPGPGVNVVGSAPLLESSPVESATMTSPQLAEEERSRSCTQCFDPSDMPSGKEITTDLANERTVLAWIRTALAVIRTVFSFATLQGLTKPVEYVDAVVTVFLSLTAVSSLLVGWQRFVAVRKAGLAQQRRLAISPMMAVLVAVSVVVMIATLLRPRKGGWLFEPPFESSAVLQAFSHYDG